MEGGRRGWSPAEGKLEAAGTSGVSSVSQEAGTVAAGGEKRPATITDQASALIVPLYFILLFISPKNAPPPSSDPLASGCRVKEPLSGISPSLRHVPEQCPLLAAAGG